jgi:hypothetical protein
MCSFKLETFLFLIAMNEQIVEKSLGNFEMWCWRRIDKIRKADRVINEEALHRGKEERNIVISCVQ